MNIAQFISLKRLSGRIFWFVASTSLLTLIVEVVLNYSLYPNTPELDSIRETHLVVFFGLFVAIVVAGIGLAYWLSRPFAILTNQLQQITNGDLAGQLSLRGMQDVVELSTILNSTLARLQLAIVQIREQVRFISETSTQISQYSDVQASGMSEQAAAISQVSSTILELSDTSLRIANSAASVAGSASNALDSANAGFDMMLGVSETMKEIRVGVNLITERILALNTLAQRIREITLLIDNLSNETHLLALNAAIESAGAGEDGARFGVVAGHVRRLAQRSRTAATEIQQLINQVQSATHGSVMATEDGIKVVAIGEKMVEDSLTVNENVTSKIAETSELAQEISQATSQQQIASTQVADTISQLAGISTSMSRSSLQYRQVAENLQGIVLQLNDAVANFGVRTIEPKNEPPTDLHQFQAELAYTSQPSK